MLTCTPTNCLSDLGFFFEVHHLFYALQLRKCVIRLGKMCHEHVQAWSPEWKVLTLDIYVY